MSQLMPESSVGIALIAEERSRQIGVEGYTPEHDAAHGHLQLASAACAYALGGAGFWWPWDPEEFKPTGDPVRDLTKAGALIAAAIDVAVVGQQRSSS